LLDKRNTTKTKNKKRKNMKKISLLFLLSILINGCAEVKPLTIFTGSPYIEGKRAQCEEVCRNWNMRLSGMVTLGEYTEGCICEEVRGEESERELGLKEISKTAILSAAAAGGGAAGTHVQKQRQTQDRLREEAEDIRHRIYEQERDFQDLRQERPE
jgi:hypothetical protein